MGLLQEFGTIKNRIQRQIFLRRASPHQLAKAYIHGTITVDQYSRAMDKRLEPDLRRWRKWMDSHPEEVAKMAENLRRNEISE